MIRYAELFLKLFGTPKRVYFILFNRIIKIILDRFQEKKVLNSVDHLYLCAILRRRKETGNVSKTLLWRNVNIAFIF